MSTFTPAVPMKTIIREGQRPPSVIYRCKKSYCKGYSTKTLQDRDGATFTLWPLVVGDTEYLFMASEDRDKAVRRIDHARKRSNTTRTTHSSRTTTKVTTQYDRNGRPFLIYQAM